MIQQTTLKNGLTVVTDTMTDVQTLSVGVFIDSGSRRETPENNGVAHFLEHMAFKGTKTRTAEQIAREIEDVGGYMNAYTSLENTAYYCRLMKEDLAIGVDVLADILSNSTFDETEMNRERGAILQEISMYKDSPDDVVVDNLRELQYPDQAIGWPILGSVENVKKMTADHLRDYVNNYYHANHMIVAAAGAVDHNELVKMAEEKFGHFTSKELPEFEQPSYKSGETWTHRPELEQVYVAYSWPSAGALDKDYYVHTMLAAVMGQGMTSKLWQEVREKRGLAYSVYASNSPYKDHGTFNVFAGTGKESLEELAGIVQNVLKSAEMTQEELQRAQKGAASSIAMAMESCEARMERLANHLFTYKRIVPIEEALEKVYAVTLSDLETARTSIIQDNLLAVSVVGPVEKK